MKNLHYAAGELAAIDGKFRVMPSNIKILTPAYREWYKGYDDATTRGDNANLTSNYSLRKRSRMVRATV